MPQQKLKPIELNNTPRKNDMLIAISLIQKWSGKECFPWVQKKKFKNDAHETIHASAQALFKVGAIDKVTLHNFEDSCCVAQDEIRSEQIKKSGKEIT